MESPFASNLLETKSDVSTFLTDLLDSLKAKTSPGGARVILGFTGTHYDEVATQLEGFSRPIWGLSSLLAGGGNYAGTDRWIKGLGNGTDEEGEEFWGQITDKDQRMVECSALGFGLKWIITDSSKENVGKWLGRMNTKAMPNTNWLWFRVFANLGLHSIDSPYFDEKRMLADLNHLDTFYIGDGWSRDGPEGVLQLDYYSSSFAIQTSQLIFAKLMWDYPGQRDRCIEYKNRAKRFAIDFLGYFDHQGRAIPFGRSLTYRFAMAAFWSACAYAEIDIFSPGVLKGLLLRNMRFWASQGGAFNADGTFTIGYVYPNHCLAENYNSPSSPYWACKAFLALALPNDHPFWTCAEEGHPTTSPTTLILEKPLHIATNFGSHTFILSSGQQCSYPVKNGPAKYGKFSYSSAFGYSVSVGQGDVAPQFKLEKGPIAGAAGITSSKSALEELAPDSALAMSIDGGESWKVRRDTRDARIERGILRSTWNPFPGVDVETWLVPPSSASPLWYLRIHRIRATVKVESSEAGWAIYGQGLNHRALTLGPEEDSEDVGMFVAEGIARATSIAGISGILDLSPFKRSATVDRTDANTNVMVPRAVLPLLKGIHGKDEGNEWLVTAVFGLPSVTFGLHGLPKAYGPPSDHPVRNWMAEWQKRPQIPAGIVPTL
ncbi:hypothetical protein C8J56DRAFT_831543 [Mycena floridula]|nr:hypothetical protein C8J56DRAFT_831543 [Mycena floridula]